MAEEVIFIARKFHFRLQPVLHLREQREEQAILAQSRAQREYLSRVEALNRINSLLEKSFTRYNEGHIQPENEFHLLLWREWLMNDRNHRQEAVARANEKLQRCRVEAFEARRERMILQRLKEKQLRYHTLEQARAGQKETDEQGLQMVWYRKK